MDKRILRSFLLDVSANVPIEVESQRQFEEEYKKVDRERLAKFFQMTVPRLIANSRFSEALATLRKTPRNAFHSAPALKTMTDTIIPPLTAVAVSKRPTQEAWERAWSNKTGKTWKALKGYPARLRKMADELDQLNLSPLFAIDRVITGKTPLVLFAKRQFLLLPVTLRRSADWIEDWTKRLPALTQHYYPPAPRGYPTEVLRLSDVAKALTGCYRDAQVAELLNAADLVLNQDDPKSGERFDAQTMADLRSRWKRKPPRT